MITKLPDLTIVENVDYRERQIYHYSKGDTKRFAGTLKFEEVLKCIVVNGFKPDKTPLSFGKTLSLLHVLSIVIFRFIYAYIRHSEFRTELIFRYDRFIPYLLGLKRKYEGLNQSEKNDYELKKVLILHLSRGLIEEHRTNVKQSIKGYQFCKSIEFNTDSSTLEDLQHAL